MKKHLSFLLMLTIVFVSVLSFSNAESGWTVENRNLAYYENGNKVTGDYRINQETYHFTDNGYLTGTGQVLYILDFGYCYIDSNNELLTGWQTIDGNKYYFDPDTYHALNYPRQCLVAINGVHYLMAPYMLTDAWAEGYYADKNGVVDVTPGYRKIGDNYYYFGDNGVKRGFVELDNGIHYFEDDGIQTGTAPYERRGWRNINEYLYHFDINTGVMSTGHCTIDGIEYDFYNDGALKVTEAIVQTGKNSYYLDSNSHVSSGWKEINGDFYYFSPEMAIGYTEYWNGNSYEYYFFDDNGKWVDMSQKAAGWLSAGNNWYYYAGYGFYTDQTTPINGILYHFDKDGKLTLGWSQTVEYGEEGQIIRWLYSDQDGTACVNTWKYMDGNWYYFNYLGFMSTGWTKIKESWFYFDMDGLMKTGWQNIDGAWYFFSAQGSMETGWVSSGSTWYYLDKSGIMLTGWQWIDNAWYYLDNNGEMKTGWYESSDSQWYYFNTSGSMVTGWVLIDGQWELFSDSGVWQYTWTGT